MPMPFLFAFCLLCRLCGHHPWEAGGWWVLGGMGWLPRLPLPLMACNIERDSWPVDPGSSYCPCLFQLFFSCCSPRYRWLSWQMLILIMEGQATFEASPPDPLLSLYRARFITNKCIKILWKSHFKGQSQQKQIPASNPGHKNEPKNPTPK